MTESIIIDIIYLDSAKAFNKADLDILLQKVIGHIIYEKLGMGIKKSCTNENTDFLPRSNIQGTSEHILCFFTLYHNDIRYRSFSRSASCMSMYCTVSPFA